MNLLQTQFPARMVAWYRLERASAEGDARRRIGTQNRDYTNSARLLVGASLTASHTDCFS